MRSRHTIKGNGFSSVSRRSVLAAAILAGGASLAHGQLYWDAQAQGGPTGGTGTWNSTNTNWWNGSADVAWDSNIANFAGNAGTVTIGSNINANSVNFTADGYALTFNGSNTLTIGAISVASGITDTIGVNAATNGGLTAPGGGLNISGGGELILAQTLLSNSPITVNGATLTVGDRKLSPLAAYASQILKGSPINLNNASLQFATSATLTGTNSPNVGPITVTGTSMISSWRTSSANSVSLSMLNSPLTMEPDSALIASAAGNTEVTSTSTPYVATGPVSILGPATFQANSGTTTAGNPFLVQWRLGNITDNGNAITFLGQGTSTNPAGLIEPYSNTYTGTGSWTIGNSNQTGTNGSDAQAVCVVLFQPSGNGNGQMTSGNITVNNYSQMYFDAAADPTTWGTNTQTITINGTGAAASISSASGTSGSVGALVFGNTAAGGTNTLNSNVALGSSAEISVTGSATNGPTIADLTGNISGPPNAVLTKAGSGTMILDGTNNSNWLGGLAVGNGLVQVNSGSALGPGPVTMASNSTPSSPSLVLNNSTQTIGSLASSFGGTTAATNTITLNGTALHIVQSGNTFYGNGTRAGQVSTITGSGSLTLDAASTGTLTLSSQGNNYSGPTTINGGTLLVTGSLTNGGAVLVAGGTLGGTGSINGAVTLSSGGTIAPGVSATTGGTLTLSGGLSIASGSALQFDLDRPNDSDTISLGSGNFSLSSGAGGIALNVNNIAGLDAGGTFPLITYSGSGPALGPNNSFAITGVLGASVSIDSIGGGLDAVDLIVPASPPLFWAAGNANWDFTSSNWKQSGNPAVFANGKNVTFDDSGGTTSTISVNIPAEVDPGQLIFNNNSRNYIVGGAGPIGGTTSLLFTGTGKVTLTSANTFTGSVSVSGGGTLSVADDSYLGGGTSVNLSNVSALQATASFSSARTIALGNGGGAIDVTSGNTLTLSGSVTGTGGLIKSDSGTLVLSGGTANNNYAGSTTISGGTLQIGTSGSVPITSDVSVASTATFDLQNHTDQINSLTVASGGFVNVNTGGTLNIVGAVSSNVTGNITGTGGTVTNSGTGTVTLGGSNSFGNLTITGGGTVVVASANALGTGISLTNKNSVLRFASNYVGNQTLTSNTTGDTVDLNGHNVTLGTLVGSGVANLINGGTITFAGVSGTANGVVVGNGGDSTTLAVNAVDTKGVSGIGGGAVTINGGSTFLLESNGSYPLTFGFNNDGAGNPGTPGTTLTTVTFNANSTFAASGTAYYVGSTSPVVGTSASVTFAAPNTNDHLIIGSAIRNPDNGGQDNSNNITTTGNGIVQVASGGVSATSGTQFDGTWNQNMGDSGILLFGGIKGGTGEVLNAPGYQQTENTGAGASININSGTIAFGADAPNTASTTVLTGLNSFRSPLNFQGSAAIASSGYEYDNAATIAAGGAVFDTTPVTANIAGDININGGVTATVDTYDPVLGAAGGARSLNFTTNYLDTVHTPGNFNFNSNSTLSVSGGGTAGGAVNFARTGPGTFSVGSNVTLNVASATGVNVGKWLPPGAGSVLTTVPGSLDPFTDNSVSSNPNNPDTTHSVSAIVAGSLDYAARTGTTDVNSNPDTGVKVYRLGGLSIQSGGQVTLDNAAANADPNPHADRTLLVTGSLSMSTFLTPDGDINPGIIIAPASLNLNNNDLLVHNGNLSTLSSYIADGLVSSSGIYSSTAQTTLGTAVGIVSASAYGAGDSSPPTTFDGMNLISTDVLIKYTYMGDTNLDGVVNSADLAILNNGQSHNLAGWQNGDLNYDGHVNADDVALFMLGAARQGAPLTSAPEPAMLGLLAMPLIACRRRRK